VYLGIITKVFQNLPLEEALDTVTSLGVGAVELGTGNYNGTEHCDPEKLLADEAALSRFRAALEGRGLTITALGCHGNPLHPDPAVAGRHDAVFRNTVLLAERLGLQRITLLSGCPGDSPGSQAPNWVTCGWPTDFPAILEWQWREKVIPYWRECAGFALSHGVSKLCFEMHPGCVVYHPPSLLRLREAIGPVVGANLDPSHLMWQGMDVIEVIRRLGREEAIYHVHAKDTALNDSVVRWAGVLDTTPLERVRERAWNFRTVGFGHGALYWKNFVSALRETGYDDVLSIEHEDPLASRLDGVRLAVQFLGQCLLADPPDEPWWT
jgi:sugar phosphate isomerase/epimerase